MGVETGNTVEKKKRTGQFWLYSLDSSSIFSAKDAEVKGEEILYHCREFAPKGSHLDFDREAETVPFKSINVVNADTRFSLCSILKAWKEKKWNQVELSSGIQMTVFLIMWFFDEEKMTTLANEISIKTKKDPTVQDRIAIGEALIKYRDELIPKLSPLLREFFPYESTNIEGARANLKKRFKEDIIPKIKNFPAVFQLMIAAELFAAQYGSLLGDIHDHPDNIKAINQRIAYRARKQPKALPNPVKEA
jgi:hypothetical protein